MAIEQVGYRPFEGRWRVIIVDDADLLVPAAQNALLKTLEEPRPRSQFVLVTAHGPTCCWIRSARAVLACGSASSGWTRSLSSRGGGPKSTRGPPRSAAAAAGGRALQMASSDHAGTREAAVGLLRSVSAARDARARLDGARAFAAGGGLEAVPAADRRELRERLRMLASLVAAT